MTKVEMKKCENLVHEAILSAERATFLWKKHEEAKDPITAEVKMRDSDQHYGYAEGIYQALVSIGFYNEGMNTLKNLL